MSDYTPATRDIRSAWIYGIQGSSDPLKAEKEFDRWFQSEIEKAERKGAFRGARALLDANFRWVDSEEN